MNPPVVASGLALAGSGFGLLSAGKKRGFPGAVVGGASQVVIGGLFVIGGLIA